MKAIVDASSRIFYASFYIEGLYEVFGRSGVSFAAEPFKALRRESGEFAFEHYFAFIVSDGAGKSKRYVVDFCDPPDISPKAYAWCDVYGKVNFDPDSTSPEFLPKLRPMPPGFGIRIWNFPETAFYAVSNFVRCGLRPLKPWKSFFRDYYDQYGRPSLPDYVRLRGKSRKGYVFLASTLWPDDERTNRNRKTFLQTARECGLETEGGFYALPDHPHYADYRHWVYDKPYSSENYISKMAVSSMAFNTPAVHGCYGWKLPEYLAMGKAIVSTPFIALSTPLEHEVHLHVVDGADQLSAAVRLLSGDDAYRMRLESNAGKYFDGFVSPGRVVEALLAI
jgi:hypothetical protein